MRTGGIYKFSKIYQGSLHIIMEDENGNQFDPIPFLDARFQFNGDQVEILDEEFGAKFIAKIDKVKDNTTEVYGTGVFTCATVTGGVRSAQTITMNTPLANVFATGTVTVASALADDTVTVNGLVYTAVTGNMRTHAQFSIDGTNTEAAEDLVRAVNGDPRVGTTGKVTADNTAGVVTFTTNVAGIGGNAITLVSSNGSRLAVSGAVLSGGVAADTITINGLVYTAVAGTPSNPTQFSVDGTITDQAVSLKGAINTDARVGTLGSGMTADNAAGVLTVTQTESGDLNATTLTSTGSARVVLGGATFASGVDGDTVTANGRVYTAVVGTKADNTEFSVDTGNTECATDFKASFNADTRAQTLGALTADNTAGAVTLTQTIYEYGDQTSLVTSNGTRLAVTGTPFANSEDAFISSTGVPATDKATVSTALQVFVGVTPA